MLDGTLFVVKCASAEIGEKTFSPIFFIYTLMQTVCENIIRVFGYIF